MPVLRSRIHSVTTAKKMLRIQIRKLEIFKALYRRVDLGL